MRTDRRLRVLMMLTAILSVFVVPMPVIDVTGISMLVKYSIANTKNQTTTPDNLCEHVMGVCSYVFVVMAPFRYFVFGLVADHIGEQRVFVTDGVIDTVGEGVT